MGWLTKKIDEWAGGQQEKGYASSSACSRRWTAASCAWSWRARHTCVMRLEQAAMPRSDPLAMENPSIAMFLSKLVRQYQKQGRAQDAAAILVWLHTMRGGIRLELRDIAREMWCELARGFPHVGASAPAMVALGGMPLNIAGANQFPIGFAPQPDA